MSPVSPATSVPPSGCAAQPAWWHPKKQKQRHKPERLEEGENDLVPSAPGSHLAIRGGRGSDEHADELYVCCTPINSLPSEQRGTAARGRAFAGLLSPQTLASKANK